MHTHDDVRGADTLLPSPGWENGPALPAGHGERALAGVFAQAAVRRPDAVAVLDRDGRRAIGFRALDRLVASWAARLVAEGVEPGTPVGLCAIAEQEVPVGFLAIMAAGGAVVPLDPSLPAERLRTLAMGVGCRLVLASDAGRGALAAGLRVLPLSDGPGDHGTATVPGDPGRTAVIYHTSGSTGRPKPVALTHRALSARMLSMMEWFGIGEDEVVCAGSTLAFDPFLQQMFFPLCSGGTLWLPERAALLDPARFWEQAAACRVSHLNLVPSQVEALLRRPPPFPPPGLRRVVMGGERMPPDLPARIVAALGDVAVYNMYGPTEATVDATGHRADPVVTDREIPIGTPLPGCRIRILDQRLERVPVGAVGELCIGGAGLALGYPGMAAETERAFIPDPFGAPGDRLYRTGDLARWDGDGRVAFVGRGDDQVKIRGQRIELGEVEAALRAAPGITAAAVLKWDEAPGGPALVAHVTGEAEPADLRAWLAERLPAAAVPAHIRRHHALPLLPSGKIDRKALAAATPLPPHSRRTGGEAGTIPGAVALERTIAAVWAGLLGVPAIDPTANLFEMGAHSLLVPRALVEIEEATGRRVSAVDLFRFPSVTALTRHLCGDAPALSGAARPARRRLPGGGDDIAVIGMAFRFPGADDRDTFWANLLAGRESLRRFDPAALKQAGAPAALVDHPDFVPVHGAIDGTDRFDPAPFGYSHGEAAEIDPQQRLLLELAWTALEDAACDPAADGPVGVFAGVGFNAYLIDNLRARAGFAGGADRYSVVVGADKDFAATRVAYKLGLTGPAMAVNSACSTALSATAVAVDSLRAGRCRVALAGAASLGMFSPHGYVHAEGGIASRTGRCRPFDAAADGTAAGAGAAVLVLKRLGEALDDGDTIHAVIRGVGVANDGADKAAFAAPSVDGQTAAIRAALDDAGIVPAAVGFVEGHGTATALGDPIEVTALNIAYRGAEAQSIPLGSVKGNIGHLDAAAGMAGLVKAMLAVRHGTIPPTAHFTAPNPRIPFADGPFRVNGAREPWPGPADRPRLAGVSGFGMGGTNIHIIIGQAPETATPGHNSGGTTADGPVLLTLSAASAAARRTLAAALADHDGTATPAEVASSLARRRPQRHRRAVVAGAGVPMAAALLGTGAVDGEAAGGTPAIAFVFPGQGAQRPGMARGLYAAVPAFRAVIDAAEVAMRGTPCEGLRDRLLAPTADAAAMAALSETHLTQPALFVTEYATALALDSAGIRPAVMAGHSVGEYAAACLAGVMGFDDALGLVMARGRLMAAAPRGAMLAVSLSEADLRPLLDASGTDLSAVNGARQCVAGGDEGCIAALADAVGALGRPARRLPVSHAFHTALMDPILDAFAAEVARVPLAPPRLPIVSTLTGRPLTDAEATDPGYWVRHLRGTVRFADALERLRADTAPVVLVEAGPGTTLTRLARTAGVPAGRAIAVQPAETPDGHAAFLEALGRLWVAGVPVDRLAAAGDAPRRVPLPAYPFERVRLWIEPGNAPPPPGAASFPATRTPATPLGHGVETLIADVWRDVLGVPVVRPDDDFLALGGDSLIAVRIAARLRERLGRDVDATVLFREGTVSGLARLLSDAAPDHAPLGQEDVREEGWM